MKPNQQTSKYRAGEKLTLISKCWLEHYGGIGSHSQPDISLRDQVETKETFSSEYKSKAWNDKSKEKSCLEKTKGVFRGCDTLWKRHFFHPCLLSFWPRDEMDRLATTNSTLNVKHIPLCIILPELLYNLIHGSIHLPRLHKKRATICSDFLPRFCPPRINYKSSRLAPGWKTTSQSFIFNFIPLFLD